MSGVDISLVRALYGWAAGGPVPRQATVLAAKWLVFGVPLVLVVAWWWPRGAGGAHGAHGAADLAARRRALVASVLSAVLAGAVLAVIAAVLDRARPFVVLGLVPLFPHAVDSSFPSDHTMLGVSLAAPLVWERSRLGLLGALLLLAALLVGTARVAAAVHWPSDIAGTALLALACGAVARPLTAAALGRISALWLARGGLGVSGGETAAPARQEA